MNNLKKMLDHAHRCGLSVVFQERPNGIAGSCYYDESTARVAEDLDEESKIVVIAHEIGHWLDFCRVRDAVGMMTDAQYSTYKNPTRREYAAYKNGWKELLWLRIDIKRDVWDSWHSEFAVI